MAFQSAHNILKHVIIIDIIITDTWNESVQNDLGNCSVREYMYFLYFFFKQTASEIVDFEENKKILHWFTN